MTTFCHSTLPTTERHTVCIVANVIQFVPCLFLCIIFLAALENLFHFSLFSSVLFLNHSLQASFFLLTAAFILSFHQGVSLYLLVPLLLPHTSAVFIKMSQNLSILFEQIVFHLWERTSWSVQQTYLWTLYLLISVFLYVTQFSCSLPIFFKCKSAIRSLWSLSSPSKSLWTL